jgi:hypothetical protein
MEKQTAVQWFYDQITRTYWDYMTTERQNELFEQANAMFEEQMAMADKNGQDRNQYNHDLEYGGAEYWDNEPLEFEQWYNETFNS